MGEEKRSKVIAFFSGDFIVTMATILGILDDIGAFSLKIMATLVLGAVGGFAGIAGKDLYNRYKKWRINKNKKP